MRVVCPKDDCIVLLCLREKKRKPSFLFCLSPPFNFFFFSFLTSSKSNRKGPKMASAGCFINGFIWFLILLILAWPLCKKEWKNESKDRSCLPLFLFFSSLDGNHSQPSFARDSTACSSHARHAFQVRREKKEWSGKTRKNSNFFLFSFFFFFFSPSSEFPCRSLWDNRRADERH